MTGTLAHFAPEYAASNTIKRDADKQGKTEVVKSAKREIIEDGQTEKGRKPAEPQIEKEASYKHENGNPQTNTATQLENQNKAGENTDTRVKAPTEKLGSGG